MVLEMAYSQKTLRGQLCLSQQSYESSVRTLTACQIFDTVYGRFCQHCHQLICNTKIVQDLGDVMVAGFDHWNMVRLQQMVMMWVG